MKRKIISLFLAVSLIFGICAIPAGASSPWDGSVASTFDGGSGTQADPYQIATGSQLAYLSKKVSEGNTYIDMYFLLTDDIALNSNKWTPIGSLAVAFSGNFDGDSHTISGLYMASPTESYQGLFGYFTTGTIQNLVIEASSVQGTQYVGGIAAYNSGTIINCGNNAVVNGSQYTGGIAGYNAGTVKYCYNAGPVYATAYVGGIVGYNYFGTSGSIKNVGVINSCYNSAYVTGTQYVGGIVGSMNGTAGSLTYCYNVGSVSGNSLTGSIVGYNNNAEISDCYYLTASADVGIGSGEATIVEKSLALMKADYFVTQMGAASIWANNASINSGYPIFRWQDPDNVYVEPVDETVGITPSTTFASGSGTKADPYLINTAAQLEYFARVTNAGTTFEGQYVKLNANILLNDGTTYASTPIGNSENPFMGTFDGGGHVVKGLYIKGSALDNEDDDLTDDYRGFFGNTLYSTITDLGLIDCKISGYYAVGGIAGANFGTIERCFVMGSVYGNSSVGGIAGATYDTIQNCYNRATISGTMNVGGIAGYNSSGKIDSCYATTKPVTVGDLGLSISGICGTSVRGSVTNCYYLKGSATVGVDGITDKCVTKTSTQLAGYSVLNLLNNGDSDNDEEGTWVKISNVNDNYSTFSWALTDYTYDQTVIVPEVGTPTTPATPDTTTEPDTTNEPDTTGGEVEVPDRDAIAYKSTHNVTINGLTVGLEAYNIGGNNYFKLRDVAYVLNSTNKQFEVTWKQEDNSIHLYSSKTYTPDGYEMTSKGEENKLASPTVSNMFLDESSVTLVAYFIENNNYFKLRDLGELFGFNVSWDADTSTVVINTLEAYSDAQ